MELERKTIALMSKQALMLIERRRQDVRDQAKEMSEIGSEYWGWRGDSVFSIQLCSFKTATVNTSRYGFEEHQLF